MKSFTHLFALLYSLALSTTLTAQWSSTDGPVGGETWRMAHNDQYLFIQTYGGAFRSADPAQGWERLESVPVCDYLWGFSVKGDTLGMMIHSVAAGTQIWLSYDQGDSWPLVADVPIDVPTVDRFFLTPHKIIVSGLQVKLESSDLGQSWDTMSIQGLAPTSDLQYWDGRLFCTKYNGYYLSDDEGATWTTRGVPGCSGCNVVGAEGDFALVRNYDGCFKRSTDDGLTWKNNNGVNLQNSYGEHAVVSGDNIALPLATSLVFSSDGGLNWQEYELEEYGFLFNDALDVFQGKIYCGVQGKGCLEFTNDPAAATEVNKGLAHGEVIKLLNHQGKLYALTPSNGIFTSDLPDLNWPLTADIQLGPGYPALIGLEQQGGYLFTAKNFGGIFRSADGGQNWEDITPAGQIPNTLHSPSFIPHQNALLLATSGFGNFSFWRSTDLGTSWEPLDSTPWHWTNLKPVFLSQGDTLFAANFYNWPTPGIYVYQSTDLGSSWTQASMIPVDPPGNVSGLYAAAGRLFVITSEGTGAGQVLASDDHGQSWQQSDLGLPAMSGYNTVSTMIGYGSNTVLAAVRGNGVFASTDGGQVWQPFDDGLGCAEVETQLFIEGDQILLATDRRGVWKRSLDDLQTLSAGSPDPDQVSPALSVVPNPSTGGAVRVVFNKPTAEGAALTLCDLAGRDLQVQTLAGGLSEVRLDKALAPGVYLLQLKNGTAVNTVKLIVQHL